MRAYTDANELTALQRILSTNIRDFEFIRQRVRQGMHDYEKRQRIDDSLKMITSMMIDANDTIEEAINDE